LLATPIFRALKKAHPALQIHFLADTYNAVAVRGNPRIDRLWIWDKKRMQNPLHFLRFLRSLRAEGFTLAVPLSSHVPSFTSYWIARLSGAKIVWAYETQPFYGGANWSRYLAHTELPNRPETDPEWVKFMALVSPLGVEDDTYAPEFEVGAENKVWAEEDWRRLGLARGDRKKIGLFFGGNPDRPERLWPASYWGDLAIKLQKDPRALLVAIVPPSDFLSGSRALERGVYGEVAARLAQKPPVYSNSSLPRLVAFLKQLDLFVCVDGGLFHMGVAAGVPTLGLFFKTDPARWAPPVAWQTVLRPLDDRPTSLTPGEVYQKISEMVLKSPVINHVE
jgi:ADP-heptose:LPS heptosyltransferase